MKNAIILHGTDLNPRSHWYGWLADELIQRGWKVNSPSMPRINKEPVEETLKKLDLELNSNTVLIGHSAGVPLILSILERSEVQIAKAFLVAGFMTVIDLEYSIILQDTYDIKKIKENSREFFIYNSIDDPYGCDDKKGQEIQNAVGGRLIIKEQGHLGDTLNGQFQELLEEILK